MKKNRPSPREIARKRQAIVLKSLLVGLVLIVILIGIRSVYERLASGGESLSAASGLNSELLPSDSSASALPVTVSVTPANTQGTSATSASSTKKTDQTLPESTPAAPAAAQEETTASTAAAAASTKAASGNTDGGAPDLSGYVVVLDPGHQLHANSDQEPLSPNSSETKDKCSSGTSGVSTGRPEYEVNLEIGLRMHDYLESLGCEVYMTRTSNDVDVSNIERANIALSHAPDVYIRLHCDGSTNSSSRGIGVFVADSGAFAGSLTDWGDMLGNCISDATGASYRGCNASSTYSGLNWATDIPSFLLEMGFMSNPTDDELLSDPDYQQEICEGVAEFVSKMNQL